MIKQYLSFLTLVVTLASNAVDAIRVGDSIPSNLELHSGFPPEKVNLSEYTAGRSIIVVGLPGAFTPTWSNVQVPGYLENQDALKAAGIDEIVVYCVNDGAVMKAWAQDQGIENSMISFMADPYSTVTRALDMEMDHPGPKGVGLINRCKRFALYIVDGEVKIAKISEKSDDPAGDDFPEDTCAPAMLNAIASIKDEL